MRWNTEAEALRKGKKDVAQQEKEAPQTEDPPHSSSESDEEEEEDLSVVNALSYDAEIVREENNPKEETPAASKKMTAEGGPSQPIRRVRRKATRPTLDQNLTDDEIDLISLKVGMGIDDALIDFQNNQKQYMKEMEEQMEKLRDTVTQLCVDPMLARPRQNNKVGQHRRPPSIMSSLNRHGEQIL